MFLLILLLDFYTFVVLLAVVLSWFGLSPDNPLLRLVTTLTEPVLAPIRRVLPDLGGFDLSPMLLLLVLQLVRRLLVGM